MKRAPHTVFALGVALGAAAAPLTAGGDETAARNTWIHPATGIELVRIHGGAFTMGSTEGPGDERPPHAVRIGTFFIGRYEVTQRQWSRVMGANPSRFSGCDDCPVEQVSWDEAGEFLRRASKGGTGLRLPTEAEWEYAAGGGAIHQAWPGTEKAEEAAEFAWYSGSFQGKSRPAGQKLPNLFSLYDMGGNVAEWCADWYEDGYYRTSPVFDPRGPAGGAQRVVRGGSWLSRALDTRTTSRSRRSPGALSPALGFRVAADAPPRDSSPAEP